MTDRELLLAYQRSPSQELFSQLVSRHVDFVHSVACRHVRRSDLAQDVSQEVFLTLFRKIRRIRPDAPLVAWLFTTTRLLSLQALRAQSRRQRREREVAMNQNATLHPDEAWSLIQNEIDEAVSRLSAPERDAILLRFFAGKSHQEIAADLAISEDASKKRLQRGLESLRLLLTGRGVALPASALSAALISHATAKAAPAAVAVAIAQSSTSAAAAASTAGTTTLKGILMALNIKTAVAITAVTIAVGVPATVAAVHYMHAPIAPPLSALVPIAAENPSDDDQLAQFNRIYKLDPGQNLARIEPPFPDSREVGFRQLNAASGGRGPGINRGALPPAGPGAIAVPPPGNGQTTNMLIDQDGNVNIIDSGPPGGAPGGNGRPVAVPARRGGGAAVGGGGGAIGGPGRAGIANTPAVMILHWTDGKPPTLEYTYWARNGSLSISQLAQQILGFSAESIEGDHNLLGRSIPGDFILRNDLKQDVTRQALEDVVSDFVGTKVNVEIRQVDRPVYVLRGHWNFKPLNPTDAAGGEPRIHLYAQNFGRAMGNASGSNAKAMLESGLSQSLKSTVIIEADGLPKSLATSTHFLVGQAQDPKAILDHVTEQTGLTWTQETRQVTRLFIELPK